MAKLTAIVEIDVDIAKSNILKRDWKKEIAGTIESYLFYSIDRVRCTRLDVE